MSVTLMTETNLYKDDAIADGLEDASKVATNYLSYNAQDGLTVGRTGQSERAVITSDGMEIYDGQNENIAEFKSVTRLGEAGKANLQLDYHSMQLQDMDGNTYMHISDARDNTGYATVSQRNVYVLSRQMDLIYTLESASDILSVTVNGSETSSYTVSVENQCITFQSLLASGDVIIITYKTPDAVRVYSFGTRTNDSKNGNYSFVCGENLEASAPYAYAEGKDNTVDGYCGHAEGEGNTAHGSHAHAEGYGNTANDYSHAEGYQCEANKSYSHAEGYQCEVNGQCSHAEGRGCIANGEYSHAEGYECISTGLYSHAEGYQCEAYSTCTHAEGRKCEANQDYSHASGNESKAYGECSYAQGYQCLTYTDAPYSFAQGYQCVTQGNGQSQSIQGYSRAEGWGSVASNLCAHADGFGCEASGRYSYARGDHAKATQNYQVALGSYNTGTTSGNIRFVLGAGTQSTPKDIMTVDGSGNTTIAGTLTQSSDKRLKLHHAYLSDQEQDVNDFINGLKPAYFEKDQAKHLGFYAQDVQTSDKWNTMVSEDTNGYLTLGYTEIIAPLVAYVQNQQKKIDSLEERIARLEQLINQQ